MSAPTLDEIKEIERQVQNAIGTMSTLLSRLFTAVEDCNADCEEAHDEEDKTAKRWGRMYSLAFEAVFILRRIQNGSLHPQERAVTDLIERIERERDLES